MPAKIIQTNQKPFNWVDVEPITLDIIENALRNARTEMDAVLFRTAMSPGIREQHDAFPMIANSAGKMVVGQFGSRSSTAPPASRSVPGASPSPGARRRTSTASRS